MARVQDQAPKRQADADQWLQDNLAEQERRHQQIIADMEQLSVERDGWIDGFLQRIQTRGFNYNCDALRKIEQDEIPPKPARPFKVVY